MGEIGEKEKLSSFAHIFPVVGILASAEMTKTLVAVDDEDGQVVFKESLEFPLLQCYTTTSTRCRNHLYNKQYQKEEFKYLSVQKRNIFYNLSINTTAWIAFVKRETRI